MDKAIRFFPHVLILFHGIGIGLFLYLTKAPEMSFLTILMSAILVLIAESNRRNSLSIFLLIFVLGYLIELIGVQTSWLFGSYAYQPAMGPVLFGTPLVIGATWYAVVAGACAVVFELKTKRFLKALIAGTLCVGMDFLIEQVATNYGLWAWENGTIPVYNYVCWFAFGTLFSYIYLRWTFNLNTTARYLYVIWLVFFAVLTIF